MPTHDWVDLAKRDLDELEKLNAEVDGRKPWEVSILTFTNDKMAWAKVNSPGLHDYLLGNLSQEDKGADVQQDYEPSCTFEGPDHTCLKRVVLQWVREALRNAKKKG